MKIRLTALLIAATLATGCTFSVTKPQMLGAAPAAPPRTLVLGDVQMGDPMWDVYKLHYLRGVSDWIKRNAGFAEVVEASAGTPPPAGSIVLVTRITEVDKGSAALRWIVGMGAGQAQVKGDVEIRDITGTVLTKFAARESYLGGAGIGGAGFLDMEDLFKRFAETVAKTTVQWSRGQPIE